MIDSVQKSKKMLTKTQAMMPLNVKSRQPSKTKGNLLPPFLSLHRWQKSKLFYFLPICFLLFGGGLVSCSNSGPLGIGGINLNGVGGNVTKISEIQKNKNSAATVHLQGQVATRAPFLGSGAYKLQDATGAVWVMTSQSLPDVGDEVLIKGQLQFQSIPVGGQDLGEVYIQEEQQLQRKAGQPRQPVPTQGSLK